MANSYEDDFGGEPVQEPGAVYIKPHVWEGQPRREEEWLVMNALPKARFSMFAGQAGIGKSRMALQLACSLAIDGERWMPSFNEHRLNSIGNAVPEGGMPVMYCSWEDGPQQFFNRMNQVTGGYEEAYKRVLYYYLSGKGPAWAPNEKRSTHIATMAELTGLGRAIRREAEENRVGLVILDSMAAAYASDMNSTPLVRAFTDDWAGWCNQTGITVLGIAHPPKSRDTSYSGSADWEAGARSLIVMGKGVLVRGKRGEKDVDGWKLEVEKMNDGAKPDALAVKMASDEEGTLRWVVSSTWDEAVMDAKADMGD